MLHKFRLDGGGDALARVGWRRRVKAGIAQVDFGKRCVDAQAIIEHRYLHMQQRVMQHQDAPLRINAQAARSAVKPDDLVMPFPSQPRYRGQANLRHTIR